jgi:hypothetical protein
VIKFLGFAPDADVTTPGVLTDCTNIVPTDKGVAGAPTAVEAITGLAALAFQARGAALGVDTAGIRRVFAGAQTRLYELLAGAWTDRSRAGNYTGSSESRWLFAQFGNLMLATDNAAPIQSSSSGAFADTATAPTARIIVSAKDFVLAFDTIDGTFGDRPDAWWCSAYQNAALWTPSVTTQATTGRLVGVPGPITAAAMLGEYCVAYKERGAYLGQYDGPPVAWSWRPIADEFGCVGPEAVADIGGSHVVVGPDDIWRFDGTRPVSIAAGAVRDWFRANASQPYAYRTIVYADRPAKRVWIFFASNDSADGTPDRALVWHWASGKWGLVQLSIETVLRFVTPGTTWDTMPGSWDALPMVPWDSPTWQAGSQAMAIFNTSHQLRTLIGQSVTSGFVTGDFGDHWRSSFLRRVGMQFARRPAWAGVTGHSREAQGDTPFAVRDSAALSDNSFDLLQDARWHRLAFTFEGDHETLAGEPDLLMTGKR